MLSHQGTQILHTERLLLRPVTMEDAEAMFENWASDPEVTKYLTWPPHDSVEVTKAVISNWLESYQRKDFYLWVIVLKENGHMPIGSISVVEHVDDRRKAEIGYCMGKPWWHKGIMSEALKAVMDFLFDQVGMNRLEARHDPRNPHSGNVMKKCGMTYEGTHRQAGRNNQGICDEIVYALLAQEIRNDRKHT